MKMYYLLTALLLTTLASISLSGCSTMTNKDAIVQKNSPNSELIILPTTHDRQAQLYENILLAKIAAGRHTYAQAVEFYIAALNITLDVELAREALILSEQLNDRKRSLQIADLWIKSQPEALLPWKVITFYSVSDKQIEQAQIGIEKILQLEPHIEEQLAFFAQISAVPHQISALQLFQTLAQRYPESPAITLALVRIHQQREEWAEALVLSAHIVKIQPGLLIAWQYQGALLIASGAKIEALNWYKKAQLQFPSEDDISHSLGQLLYDLDRFEEARVQFETIAIRSVNDLEAQYMIASCYYSENNYPMSRQYFEPLLRIRRHRNPVLFYLGEMARIETDFNSAINFYRQISYSRYYQTAHSLVARLMQQQGEYQQALSYLDSLQPNDEDSKIEFKLTKLRIMHQQGDNEQLEKYLIEVLQQHQDIIEVQLYRFQWLIEKGDAQEIPPLIPAILSHFPVAAEQKRLILTLASLLQEGGLATMAINLMSDKLAENEDTDYRYMRALVAANLDDITLAEADLRFILAAFPDHTDALNALGYTLADANKNLHEAQQMIAKAYQSKPNNAAIADSMGWVLYRLGKLTEAMQYLEQAYQLEPSDDIAVHLAVVLWHLDNKDSAKEILSAAIKRSPDSHVIKAAIKKFNLEIELSPSKS